MENQKPDYYTNKKRKIVDFLTGIALAFFSFVVLLILISLLVGFITGKGDYGITGMIVSPFIILLLSGIWLFSKPKNKFIALGTFLTALIPILVVGSCSLITLGLGFEI